MLINTKDAEIKLVEMIGDIEDEKQHWKAIHFHFSELLSHYRSESQLKIAVNVINDLLKSADGGIFVLSDSDIVVLCRSVTKNLTDKIVFQLRYFFVDDPLAYHNDGSENEEFCSIFDLGERWKELFDYIKRKITLSRRKDTGEAPTPPMKKVSTKAAAGIEKSPVASEPVKFEKETGKHKGKAFSSRNLADIERDLTNADVSMVLRRQPVCAAVPSMMIRRVFDEIYINISHLRQMLRVDADLLSNRWLFKYLTQLLDGRMLDMLRRSPARYFDLPVSLNLNVDTLLSNQFAEFDAVMKPATKVSIVIEIQIADVFADMAAFMTAKEYVQKLGYRVCLDGLTTLSFTQIDRERLGFDLAKLQWNADIESDLKSKENKKVAEAIKACGPNRVILCRCDTRQAIDYGQAMGISLFQGRFLDMIMNPTAKIEN